jgi:hypothetical protein
MVVGLLDIITGKTNWKKPTNTATTAGITIAKIAVFLDDLGK